MKKLQKFTLISAFLIFAMFAGPTGCNSTLEKGGAYAPAGRVPDKAFYIADAAFDMVYSSVNAAFEFEKRNRLALWRLSPTIKHGLDKIRPTASDVVIQWAEARELYEKNPTPEGLNRLQTILAKMQQVSSAVATVLPQQ